MPRRTFTTTVCRSLLICALATLAAGCGLQKAPGSGGSGAAGTGRQHRGHGVMTLPSASGSPTAAASACTIADVQITVDTRASGVAAGTSYLPLDFTNTSRASCQLAGFPAVMTESGKDGKQIGVAAMADTGAAARVMVLADGQTAHTWLRVVDVANIPKARCDPVAAAGLRVGLPGGQQTTYIGHRLTTCARAVHGTQVLTVEPFRPGGARQGTAQ